MSSHGSKLAVFTAIGVNGVIMLVKGGTFLVTGSGSMLSEAVHSAADVGNQALLAVGMRTGEKPADDEHPGGYGREAFVWSLISAVGMFFLGCGVSITHGVNQLRHGAHGDEQHGMLNIGILLLALVLEGGSAGVAIRGMLTDAKKAGMGITEYFEKSDDPFGIAVLFEDGAAILGVLFALIAVALTQWTGHAYWDALGSIVIGVLLGFVAVFLIQKNRTLLIGKSIHLEDQARLRKLLASDPAVESVKSSTGWVVGTSAYRINTELDFDGRYFASKYLEHVDAGALHQRLDSPDAVKSFLAEYSEDVLTRMGKEIDRIEDKIRLEMPKARHIAIEPD
ncbi:MAG: cation diffusion facilitator family transporter [Myxococcota bacterium]